MKIAVLGTGKVGRALADRLAGLGHDVVVGTRDVEKTLARGEQASGDARLLPFAAAAEHGEVVINATRGVVSLQALETAGAENLGGKVVVDLALPLDLLEGMPPKLTIANTDSLGEQIQRAFPDSRVVKTLNTVFRDVMVEPTRVPGRHTIFVAGDDSVAKETTKGLLREFGWPEASIIDLGGIQSARATEMYMQLYFTLVGVLDTFDFNVAVVRA